MVLQRGSRRHREEQPSRAPVPGPTFEEEADLAWRDAVAIAVAAGFSSGELLHVQCVLADIGDLVRFRFGAKIEIQAVAGRRG